MAKSKKKQTENLEEARFSLKQMIKSEGFRFATGIFFLAFALFALFAFTSYLFSWWVDYDKLASLSGSSFFAESSLYIRNITGRMGASIAHFFIYKGFGIASYLFILLATGLGLKYLKIPVFNMLRLTLRCVFFLVWISIMMGFITMQLGRWSVLGGVFGYEVAFYLKSAIGIPGFFILMLALLLVFLSIAYKISFKIYPFIQKLILSSKKSIKEDLENLNLEEAEDAFSLIDQIQQSSEEETEDFDEDEEDGDEEEDEDNIEEEENEEEEDDDEVPFTIETNSEGTAVPADEEDEVIPEQTHGIDTPYDPYEDLPKYKFPTLDLLEDYGMNNINSSEQSEELINNKKLIESTLKNFGVDIAQIKATIGPTVTLYEIVPAAGVRISKIQNLENDIALSLAALGIRIIAPIPGKGTIGIEVPNQVKQIVPMKMMLGSPAFKDTKFDLPLALGKTIQNEYYIADLAKMPHMLMAGATGQGKSVGLNAIISSLLYKKHPADLKFVMVDPKKVELTLYNKIERHYLAKLPDSEDAIITDTKKVVRTLNSLCIEMDQRYDLLKDAQVKNIKEYNAKFIARRLNPTEGHRYLPYIVLIVDEFADLIMTAGKEVELPIARLAQLARAIGIHLIIATQRPSVNIITGTIKANFPARVAFRVTSKIDSRTILDSGGADQLIGKGDMLLSTGSDLIRLQCALIDTPEIEKVADFIGEQRAYPEAYALPECPEDGNQSGGGTISASDRDSMFEDAARLIVNAQSGSTSLIQRKLKLGYARSGRIMDELEDAGIVGPSQGSKPREVLVKDIITLENILNADNDL